MDSEVNQCTKILIVDDDKAIADILKDIVAAKDRTVEVCHDGVEAIECIQHHRYDLIIVDLVMPRVGGVDVLRYAKKANPDVLVIIFTGHASIETAITAIREGAYDYIRKPCKLEEIRIAVQNAVDKINLINENKRLLKKLQETYHELMILRQEKGQDKKVASVNFFSSNMPSLHYLYNKSGPAHNYVDKLQAISDLKESGSLSDSEFKAFKDHLLQSIDSQKEIKLSRNA